MRIAFVSPNREQLPDPVIPLGLLQVAASCPDHERLFVDLCFEDDPEQALRSFLRDARPDLVAMGVRNVQGNDYGASDAAVRHYAHMVRVVREETCAPVVLGGGGFSVLPGGLLEAIGADYGVTGEGELAFPRLVRALSSGGEGLDQVGGLYRRVEGGVEAPSGREPPVDLSTLRTVDRRWVDARHYARVGTDAVQTKRGCPLTCSYCTYPTIEGRTSRLRPPAHVADELAHVREAAPEARHFFVVDSVFNLPSAHASAVCDALVERRIGLPWTCYVNPIGFGKELAERMARAGCVGMEVGSDSGSDDVLDRLRKGFRTDDVRRMSRVARDAGIKDCHTFILGTPGETLDEVRRTLDFLDALDPFAAILMVWNDERESLDPDLRAARADLRARVLELVGEEARARPHWVVPALGLRFRARTLALLRRRRVTGPLWQLLRAGREAG